jgi:hypothetical protein
VQSIRSTCHATSPSSSIASIGDTRRHDAAAHLVVGPHHADALPLAQAELMSTHEQIHKNWLRTVRQQVQF